MRGVGGSAPNCEVSHRSKSSLALAQRFVETAHDEHDRLSPLVRPRPSQKRAPMSTTPGGLSRRRGAPATSSTSSSSSSPNPPAGPSNPSRPSTPHSNSANGHGGNGKPGAAPVAGAGGGTGHKIAFDRRDMETGESRIMPKLTLMEEVLLLGLKDKQVSLPRRLLFLCVTESPAGVVGAGGDRSAKAGLSIVSWGNIENGNWVSGMGRELRRETGVLPTRSLSRAPPASRECVHRHCSALSSRELTCAAEVASAGGCDVHLAFISFRETAPRRARRLEVPPERPHTVPMLTQYPLSSGLPLVLERQHFVHAAWMHHPRARSATPYRHGQRPESSPVPPGRSVRPSRRRRLSGIRTDLPPPQLYRGGGRHAHG